MNAIIALCHFCDSHGPKTLFCTQAFKYSDFLGSSQQQQQANDLADPTKQQQSTTNSFTSTTDVTDTFGSGNVLPGTKTFSPDFTSLNRRSANSSSSSGSTCAAFSTCTANTSAASDSTCKACRAFEKNFHHYISYDTDNLSESMHQSPLPSSPPLQDSFTTSSQHDNNNPNANQQTSTVPSPNGNNICFISQSKPSDPEIYAIVRAACIRTLHCEVFEDPIYFDDVKDGSVIGYEFRVKDSEARGYQRSYSLVIIMKDRIYLQHLWTFLSNQMAVIAGNIKKQAQAQYDKEIQATLLSNDPGTATGNGTNNPFLPQLKKRPKQQKSIRGLIELTDDPMIFAKLHMWFTWILRMSSCQISEEFIHGPLSEDTQVKIEREQQFNEIIKLGSLGSNANGTSSSINQSGAGTRDNAQTNKSQSRNSIDELDNSVERLNVSFGGVPLKIDNDDDNKPAHSIMLDDITAADSETENELVLENFQVETLRQLIQIIGKDAFHQVAYNTIVGNQVIVQGKYERLVTSIIRILEELIPLGCCQTVYYSSEYIKSYQCKLLGLSEKVQPIVDQSASDDIDPTFERTNIFGDLNEFIYLKVGFTVRPDQLLTAVDCDVDKTVLKLGSYEFTYLYELIQKKNFIDVNMKTNVINIDNQIPSVLVKLESYLLNEKLEEKSVNCMIKLAKEEWLNKTKVFYKFVRSPLIKSTNDIDSVLKMLNLEKKDELALKYWQAGLSNECKQQIRTVT